MRFFRRMADLDNTVFSTWARNSRPWLVNVKSSINSGGFDSWLSGGGNTVVTNETYWLSDKGMKVTKECKCFWENGENIDAYETIGNPAEATNDELLAWAGNMMNQDQRKRLVLSIARLTDDVLRESYVDGRFLVELKNGCYLFR